MKFGSNALIFAATSVVALLVAPPSTHACSCQLPFDWGFLAPQDGRLPANAVGIAWYSGVVREPENLPSRFTIEVREDTDFRSLPVSVSRVQGFPNLYLVGPDGEALRPGETYRFTVDSVDEYAAGNDEVLVTIDDERLFATTRLDLAMGPVSGGSIRVSAAVTCSAPLTASQIRVEAVLAHEAQSWREHLMYRTVIDGSRTWQPWKSACSLVPQGRTWENVGHDRIFAGCDVRPEIVQRVDSVGLEPGRHTVMIQATLPGTSVVLETPVRSVDLRCP